MKTLCLICPNLHKKPIVNRQRFDFIGACVGTSLQRLPGDFTALRRLQQPCMLLRFTLAYTGFDLAAGQVGVLGQEVVRLTARCIYMLQSRGENVFLRFCRLGRAEPPIFSELEFLSPLVSHSLSFSLPSHPLH